MHLDFTRLEIQDFKTFGKKQTLSLSKLVAGVYFVRGDNKAEPRLGSNGSGKSSLFDALTWVLYGRTVDGLRNPDIKPWGSIKTATRVSVRVHIDDKSHTITRTTSPNTLTINGDNASQESVVELIGMDLPVFSHTILLGQGQPLFFDLKPTEKMDLFTDVLALERWEARSKMASERVAKLTVQEIEAQATIASLRANLNLINEDIDRLRERSDTWSQELAESVARYETQIEDYTTDRNKKSAMLDEAKLAEDSSGTELRALRDHRNKIAARFDDAAQKRATIRATLNAKKDRINEAKNELKASGKDGRCPTCGQILKGIKLADHHEMVKLKIKGLEETSDELVLSLRKASKRYDEVAYEMTTARKHEDEFQEKFDDAHSRCVILGPAVSDLDAKIASLKEQRKTRETDKNPYHEQLIIERKRKSSTNGLINEAEDLSKIIVRRVERARFWVRGFKDVRLYIIEEVLQELELTTNAALDEVGLSGWKVRYAIEKETKSGTIQRGLNVEVLSPSNKTAVRWESWSGGESQRLRLVGALALSEVLLNYAGIDPGMEILDEPTQHLSVEGGRDLIAFLPERARALNRQIFYVDHTARESSQFAGVLTVTKEYGESRISFGEYDDPNLEGQGEARGGVSKSRVPIRGRRGQGTPRP